MIYNKIIAFEGVRGSFKSCYATKLAFEYTTQEIKVFSNIEFKEPIEYELISADDLKVFSDFLHDGVIILDEAHMGADSYKFLTSNVQDLTMFITQIRKRRLNFIYITQELSTIAKRLRDQTDIIYLFTPIDETHAGVIATDKRDHNRIIFKELFYGRPYFNMYDTEQLIRGKSHDAKKQTILSTT